MELEPHDERKDDEVTDTNDDGLTIKQRADAEAEAAEAEDPDAEPVEPDEPAEPDADDEDPEVADPEPEAKVRKVKSPQEKFQAAFAAFVKKSADCFEITPADVVVAPHPGVVGIMLPGFAEPRTHENYKGCPTCNTIGEVLTGANTGKHENDWHVCPDGRCKGRGYWEKSQATTPTVQTGPLAVTSSPEPNGEYAEAPAWMGDPKLSPAA